MFSAQCGTDKKTLESFFYSEENNVSLSSKFMALCTPVSIKKSIIFHIPSFFSTHSSNYISFLLRLSSYQESNNVRLSNFFQVIFYNCFLRNPVDSKTLKVLITALHGLATNYCKPLEALPIQINMLPHFPVPTT